ncbi:MAG: DUF2206 domain-containing protein [Candidatus Bathyarchaeota archaeon]|nr:DUF2206 domain-containing protein [Candidatus Bathyarchaeota archaeon]
MIFNRAYLFQNFLAIAVLLQIVMYIALFFDLQLARQVIGTVYLTVIPGLIVVKLLKLEEKFATIERVLFSVGFSIAFLMFSGLLINEFGYLFGLGFPLATLPLSLFINTLILVGAAVAYIRQRKIRQPATTEGISFSPALLLLTLIPLLSIVGIYFVNTTGNNTILLVMIVAIAILGGVSTFFEKSASFYIFAIFMIAIALLFHVSLLSNYIVPFGSDSPAELYVFRNTQLNSHWNPVFAFPADEGLGRFNAMLSITILPTVYSNIIGMDGTWIFKIIYPIIFALVPIALYQLWQPYIGKKFAFLATFLFMAQLTFFTEMVALNRQIIAELFFVLLFLLLLNKKITMQRKFIGFAVFSFGLIFSHYALAQIFLFLILAAWSTSVFYLKKPSLNLKLNMIVFLFVAIFAWYIYTSGAVVFNSFLSFTGYVYNQLGGFFNPASRGQAVLTGLGLAQSPSLLNTISRGFAYLTEIFIVIGVVALVRKKTRFAFERDYTVFSLVAVAFLVLITIVPGLANTLSMTRFYHILLMFLAPFCIIGIWAFVQFIQKQEDKLLVSLLAVIILVPYFLFQTNFVYEVAGADSWSMPLSGYRMDPLRFYGEDGYIDSYSVYGAQWLSRNVRPEWNIVADSGLFTSLTAYGLVYRGYVSGLNNYTVLRSGQFVYLSYISIGYEQSMWNGTLPKLVNQTDVVYCNGGSEVRAVK